MLEASTDEARKWRLVALGLLSILALIVFWFLLRIVPATKPETTPAKLPAIGIEAVSFGDLPGWAEDQHVAALPPFLLSCGSLLKREPSEAMNTREALGPESGFSLSGNVEDWLPACAAAENVTRTDQDAKAFFEIYFEPIRILQPDDQTLEQPVMTTRGLFTGYFEPAYRASREETDEYSVPVLAKPADLVMVDLGTFRQELAGKRIAGSVKDGRLIPYADHEQIVTGGLQTEVLGWMNPNDLLFLQIQGSGKLQFPDAEMRVGYAAQNGHQYTAIGGPLIRSGAIPREKMSMQAIYDWLDAASPEDAAALRYVNESYVFFRPLEDLSNPDLGPLGASGLQLTSGRSLAVDRQYHAMGVPVWIDIEGVSTETRQQKLVIAQDTGGAIKGPVRGDLFVGSGSEAGRIAGAMRQSGDMFVLLPKQVAERLGEENDQTALTQH